MHAFADARRGMALTQYLLYCRHCSSIARRHGKRRVRHAPAVGQLDQPGRGSEPGKVKLRLAQHTKHTRYFFTIN